MKFWPLRRETRAQSYTDELVKLLESQRSGEAPGGDPLAIAAAEIAAGLYGRSFATAKVEPLTPATEAVSPHVLELIGREIIRRGECVFLIQVENGQVRLDPASAWSIAGRPDPATWLYECTLVGPSITATTRRVPAARVIHVRYGARPSEPWRGVGPLSSAKLTALLGGNLEQRLSEETGMASGQVMGVPDGTDKGPLQADLRAMKGRIVLVDSMAAGWGAGREQAPRRDLYQQRVGADPPATLEVLRSSAARHVLAACGVPIELVESAQGTGAREGFRRFLHSSVAAVGKLISAELATKLNVEGLTLDFDQLHASDISGRARAFGSMVTAGMDISKAAALSGLMVED